MAGRKGVPGRSLGAEGVHRTRPLQPLDSIEDRPRATGATNRPWKLIIVRTGRPREPTRAHPRQASRMVQAPSILSTTAPHGGHWGDTSTTTEERTQPTGRRRFPRTCVTKASVTHGLDVSAMGSGREPTQSQGAGGRGGLRDGSYQCPRSMIVFVRRASRVGTCKISALSGRIVTWYLPR